MFLKILQYSRENICIEVFSHNKVEDLQIYLQKRFQYSCFPVNIFKNRFFYRAPPVVASCETILSFRINK